MATKIPALSEFIDLGKRRAETRIKFPAMQKMVTVAVYNVKRKNQTYQTLTIRISEDLALKHNLIEGARMTVHVHPDQQYIALMAGKGSGAALRRPKGSRSLTYQTTLREGTLTPQTATRASIQEVDHALVISIA